MPSPIPEGEAEALRRCLSILARHTTPAERSAMAGNTDKRISGEDRSTLLYAFHHLSRLFYPSDDARARQLEEAMKAARAANSLTSRVPAEHARITLSDLAIWPDCPPLPAESPLRYWLPAIPVETSQQLHAQPRAPDKQTAAKVLRLDAGTEHIHFKDLADLIAEALWPESVDPERWRYAAARVNLDAELEAAVRSGSLPVKDPLTFGPHTFPIGAALKSSLVAVQDLRTFVQGRGIVVRVDTLAVQAEGAQKPSRSSAQAEGLLGTKDDLLALLGGKTLEAAFPHHREKSFGLLLKADHELMRDGFLRLEHDGRQFDTEEARTLLWTPGPADEPALPFPFNARQLAAFMVFGAGDSISDLWPEDDVADSVRGINGAQPPHAMRLLHEAHRLLKDAEKRFPFPEEKFTWSAINDRAKWLLAASVPAVYQEAELSKERARFWLSMDCWSQAEAALLLIGIDPGLATDAARARGGRWDVGLPEGLPLLTDLLERAEQGGALAFPAQPKDVIDWAMRKQLRLPALLIPDGCRVEGGKWVTPARAHLSEEAGMEWGFLLETLRGQPGRTAALLLEYLRGIEKSGSELPETLHIDGRAFRVAADLLERLQLLPDIDALLLNLTNPRLPLPVANTVAPSMAQPSVEPLSPPARTHKLQRRADPLREVISLAANDAVNSDDWPSVWAALVAHAQSPDRRAPLLGYSEGDGIKYQADNHTEPVKWLSKEAFRKRFARAMTKAAP